MLLTGCLCWCGGCTFRTHLTFFLTSPAPLLRSFLVPCLRVDLLYDKFFFCSRLATIPEVRIPVSHQLWEMKPRLQLAPDCGLLVSPVHTPSLSPCLAPQGASPPQQCLVDHVTRLCVCSLRDCLFIRSCPVTCSKSACCLALVLYC